MKKYRTLKKFPRGPEIGTIVSKKGWRGTIDWIEDNHLEAGEFFEEVIEKDYEVLDQEYIPGNSGRNYGHDAKNANMRILKVRRLSDNVEFSVGDKVKLSNGEIREIISLTFEDWYGGELMINKTLVHLKEARKVTKFLTTFDGIDIYEGDDYWVYDFGELKNTPHEIFKVNNCSQTHDDKGINRKYFSTKTDAEYYVSKNKPKFSEQDMLDFTTFCSTEIWAGVTLQEMFNNWKNKMNK